MPQQHKCFSVSRNYMPSGSMPMSIIHLQTVIKAPIEVCFDLSRSIELHKLSTAHTNETAIAGKTTGLCESGDTITWRAKHFGIYQKLTVEVTKCTYPNYFEDQMVRGAFKSFVHQHHFRPVQEGTLMEDIFNYVVPFGLVGKWFDKIILNTYMTNLLVKRNETIKKAAESSVWRTVLPEKGT